jgi:tetratricopeptide (TPR) repeat protein
MTDAGGGGTAARRAARAKAAKTVNTGKAGKTTLPSDTGSNAAPRVSRRELDPDALAAIEEERDFLLRSLEDLEREHDVGDVDDADYDALKDDYTARAAASIRAVDDRHALARSTQPTRNWRRNAVGLVLVGVIALGVGWVVFRNAGTRAPGQGLTGDVRQDSANLILQAQGFTGQATAALQSGDSTKALDLFERAIQTYGKALEVSPGNVEALTDRAWVLHSVAVNSASDAAAQLDAQVRQGLDDAIAIDPKYSQAHVFRAVLERNAGEFAAAQADLDAVDMDAIPTYMTTLVQTVRDDVAARRRG